MLSQIGVVNTPDASAATVLQAISTAELDPLFWRSDRVGVDSAWYGHVPFAHWLVRAAAPRCVVELGTHNGVSYAAFCGAVQREGLGARCFAVDTWAGDPHAGLYGEEVFERLREYHDARFGAFSTLIRKTFDDALPLFADGSIDILHIDGLHTYEAVKHDFESWRPKLSDRGVVLFHDINVRERDFGVWRLWAELAGDHPSFEFVHAHGLGLLLLGGAAPPLVEALANLTDPLSIGAIRERFTQLGERNVFDAQLRLQQHIIAGHRQREGDHEARLASSRGELASVAAELATVRLDLAQTRSALEAAQAVQGQLRGELAATIRVAEAANCRADAAGRSENQARSAQANAHSRERAFAEQAGAARAAASAAQEEAAAERAAADAARAAADAAEAGRLHEMHHRHDVEAALATVFRSSTWKATVPLRALLGMIPATLRPSGRRLLQTAERGAPALPPAGATAVAAAAVPPFAPAQSAPAPRAAQRTVCCISGEPDTPGTIYRVEQFAEAAGWAGARTMIWRLDELAGHEAEIDGIDVLLVWRAVWSETLAGVVGRARSGGAMIVFDVDDLMIDPALATIENIDGIRSQNLVEEAVRGHYALIQQTMLAADACTASTRELAGHMRRFGMPSVTLPNGFSADTLRVSRMAARRRRALAGDDLVRLGYAGGSRTHQKDFAVMASSVVEVLRAHPHCRLVLFQTRDGAPLVELEEFAGFAAVKDQIEWRTLVPLHALPEEIARFDVNLAPLQLGNPFCEAKSELKYFEAALAGVCTVASPTGPFARAIRDGVTGFLAATPEQWRATLTRLVAQPALRRGVAGAALDDVLWTYGPERRGQQVRRLLAEWRGGADGADAFALELPERSGRRRPGPEVPGGEVLFTADRLRQASVTVVVPLYNYAHTVVETLDSVRAQSLDPLDLVIVDDASTDRSLPTALAWVEAHAGRFNRVTVIRNHVNAGLANTRNAGFAAADTPYVMPLDADNLLRPACCAALLGTIESEGCAYVYPVIQEFGERSGLTSTARYLPGRLIGGNYIDAMALVRKSAWSAVGGYHDLRGGWEDYDFWCSLAERGLSGHGAGGAPLAAYRVHPTSMLNQVTDKADTKPKVIRAIERRHPWVSVAAPLAARSVPPVLLPADERLARLLPILRCPRTGQGLHLADGMLHTADGGQTWPLKDGRPVLYPGLAAEAVASFDHTSNDLPDSALEIIGAARGLVLNLSAGGTVQRWPNVVEVEAAVFRHTDLVADSHALPFADETFDAVIVMNAFEHYRQPFQAAAEIRRVLCPGGRLLVRTAFLQPQHEAPWHFFNATRHGVAEWFAAFETERLHVSENFNPAYAFSWLASECEAALRRDLGDSPAAAFAAAPVSRFVAFWRDQETRDHRSWHDFERLTQSSQDGIAAGFEYLGRKP